MPEHALGRENDQRLAPMRQCLSTQQMKVLRGVGWLADLEIVTRGQLQKSFDACAGVLWSLAFVAMRQKQNDAGEQVPLVFAGADKLIDHGLRNVGKIAKLRFPQHQCFWIVAAVAILESQHSGFRERGVVDLAASLVGRNVLQGYVFLFILDVEQHGMPLIESATAAVLTAETNRNTGFYQASKG